MERMVIGSRIFGHHYVALLICVFVVCQHSFGTADDLGELRRTAMVKAVEKVQPAIAAVYVFNKDSRGSGSGSVIDPRGYVLTAKHVTGESHVVLLHGRPPVKATLIGSMPEYDLAILKLGRQAFNRPASPRYPLDGTPHAFVRLGIANEVLLGESIFNIGNPGGRGIVVTRGIISSLGIYGGTALSMATQSSNGFNQKLQFDASSNPGNSGGALINVFGQQVAVVTSSIRSEEGIHFATPLHDVRSSISQMLYPEFRNQYRSGITIDPQLTIVKITAVEADSPAAAAGLTAGDVISKVNGRKLRDPIDWEFTRLDWKPQQSHKLSVDRDGKEVPIELVLEEREPMPGVDIENAQPGLLCRASPYDPNNGAPLDDEDWPSKEPLTVPTVMPSPDGLNSRDHYELVYEGFLKIDEAGLHRIAIQSDDGSKLYVHDTLVVDNNGNHADQIRTGWVDLAVGLHPIRIEYYEDEGNATLELLMVHGDGEPTPVSADHLFHHKDEQENE